MQTVEVMKPSILANPHCRLNRGGTVLRVLVVPTPGPTQDIRVL